MKAHPTLVNPRGIPELFVEAIRMIADEYDDGGADISVTSLIAPPQLVTLLGRHGGTLTEDVNNRGWSFYGQLGHKVMHQVASQEKYKDRFISETRLFTTVNGWKVSGQLDLYDRTDGTLMDHKFVGEFAYLKALEEGKREWEEQLNLLRYLLAIDERFRLPAKKLLIGCFVRDYTVRSERLGGYIEMPVWTFDEAEAFLKKRVALHQMARNLPDEKQPSCTDEERWRNPRTGEYNRCKLCVCRTVCHQYTKEGIRVKATTAEKNGS